MEVGAARSRRRSAARNDHVALSWMLRDIEMLEFRAWFDSATGAAAGTAWFTVDLPVGDGGIASVEARFVDIFKADLLPGLRWHVSAKVEIR
jgi:hypothetical protein